MAKFRYYITDLFCGAIVGTDDLQEANEFSLSDDHFVVDSETGESIINGGRSPIAAANS